MEEQTLTHRQTLTAEQLALIEAEAARRGITPEELLRQVFAAAVAKHFEDEGRRIADDLIR